MTLSASYDAMNNVIALEPNASMMLPADFLLTLLSLRSIVHLNLCGNSLA